MVLAKKELMLQMLLGNFYVAIKLKFCKIKYDNQKSFCCSEAVDSMRNCVQPLFESRQRLMSWLLVVSNVWWPESEDSIFAESFYGVRNDGSE